MVGQNNQLKGGSHQPYQCSINVWERVEINVLLIPNNRIDTSNCGCFTTMQNGLPLSARHKYLPRKVLVRLVKNLWTKGCKGKLERWSDIILNWRGRATPFSVWSVAGNSKRVSLNPKRGQHLKLRMLFEWAKEPLSHYPLGSQDYTRIDFSCNIMKYECEVLR